MQLPDVEATFAQRVVEARPRVEAVVARLVGEDAEDVFQEAVLRAYLSLSQLRDADRFESWLCGIAINVAKMRLRRAATYARAVAAAATFAPDAPEFAELVRDAVEVLPPGQRDAVLLHYVDDLSCDEIAALLGTSPGAVRVRLHRAREQLRAALAPHIAPVSIAKEERMIEMQIEDVVVRVAKDDPSTLVWDGRVIVLRERDGERLLPIWVAAPEGNALAVRLRDASPPRPLTSDLMVELVRSLGGTIERVAVTRLEDNVFYASIAVAGTELDARPSDALNLAVRTGAPIVVAPAVLDEGGHTRETLAARLEEVPPPLELPDGEWRSLTEELLRTMYTMPTR